MGGTHKLGALTFLTLQWLVTLGPWRLTKDGEPSFCKVDMKVLTSQNCDRDYGQGFIKHLLLDLFSKPVSRT